MHTHWTPIPLISTVLLCLLAKEARAKQGERGAFVVKGHISNPRYRPRLLPAAPLVVRRSYWIVVPRPLPAAPLVVRRRYLVVVTRPLSAAPLVVCRRHLIVARRSFLAAPLVICRRYLIVVPRSLLAAPLVVRHRYFIVVQQGKNNSADLQGVFYPSKTSFDYKVNSMVSKS